ncbi:MAG: alkaline phosphatase family protein [Candidatus Moranbacteria bacterium]|nr:alkaline phosphatase family protein [Candidatus Moranbacteria bacterium]
MGIEMNLPDYRGGSIVNLMGSIKKAFGGSSLYGPLEGFDVSSLAKKNIVMVVIDGLGYEYLVKYGQDSFLHKNLKGKMTSVFPATTAAAITSFLSGVAPQQHALTGWFMYLKEIGILSVVIRFASRAGRINLCKSRMSFGDIYGQESFFEKLDAASFLVKRKEYIGKAYSLATSRGAERLGYVTLNGFFRQIRRALDGNRGRKYVFAYWDKFDSVCHKKGTDSREAERHFRELDKKIASLAKSLKNKDTAIIVTADHGLIDTRESDRIIELKDHPEFVATLSMPLAGELRAAYCYVKPDRIGQFEDYVKRKFSQYCDMHKSVDLIEKNYFGLYEPDKRLKDRIGDYTLIMKENYIIKDSVLGEEYKIFIGNHGGTSKEEMFVPLIVIG